jgi:hypothetical protein
MTDGIDSVEGAKPGDVIAGKYRVERVLGAGGMGVVVAAQHVQLDEKVALKFLLPQATVSPEAIARFEREARAASKIKSEHVARVTDVGLLETGAPYMVMEYLNGEDLSGWLAQRGALPLDVAVDFVLQACEAIGEAHTLGIVHRDLKPANLFCIERADGQLFIKVLDFGISKLTTPGSDAHALTRTTAFMGSPLYMSPEQMQMSKGVDARTDIWSLGIILFELATGRAPFDAEAVTELAIKIATAPHLPMRDFRNDAPVGLERVVAKCLEKDRARRYQTIGELAEALRAFAPARVHGSIDRIVGTERRARGSGRPVAQDGYAVTALHPSVQTDASWGKTGGSERRARRRGALGVAVLLTVCVLALGALVVRRGLSGASTAQSALAPFAAASTNTTPAEQAPTVAASPPEAAASPPTAAVELPAASASAEGNGNAREVKTSTRTGASPVTAPPVAPPAGLPAPVGGRAPSCNPPYVIDSAGNHQYKPECM